MKKKGRTPLGLARSRQTKSEINVQTPSGLQNLEMLINLAFSERTLLRTIHYFFDNEHSMYRRQAQDLMFDLVVQVAEKIVDGTIPLNFEDYYDGVLDNEMDHANITRMRHLLRDAADHLDKQMHNPGIAQGRDRVVEMDTSIEEDRDEHERLRTTDDWF